MSVKITIEESKSELARLERELKDNAETVQAMIDRQDFLNKEINRHKNRIRDLTPKTLEVSDHAVLRYIERHVGINVDRIRDNIASTLSQWNGVNGDFGGFRIQNNKVVTYVGE